MLYFRCDLILKFRFLYLEFKCSSLRYNLDYYFFKFRLKPNENGEKQRKSKVKRTTNE
jgi:hypothetical protein